MGNRTRDCVGGIRAHKRTTVNTVQGIGIHIQRVNVRLGDTQVGTHIGQRHLTDVAVTACLYKVFTRGSGHGISGCIEIVSPDIA